MNTFGRTKKIVGMLILLVLAAGGVVYGMFWLIRHNIQETVRVENLVQERQATESTTKALREFVNEVEGDLATLESRIVPANEAVKIIELVESLAKKERLSVEVQAEDQEYAPSKEELKLLALVIRTQGAWSSTYRFLSMLESLPYKTSLKSVTIQHISAQRQNASSTIPSWAGTYRLEVLQYK
jgi:hypothetical protein